MTNNIYMVGWSFYDLGVTNAAITPMEFRQVKTLEDAEDLTREVVKVADTWMDKLIEDGKVSAPYRPTIWINSVSLVGRVDN